VNLGLIVAALNLMPAAPVSVAASHRLKRQRIPLGQRCSLKIYLRARAADALASIDAVLAALRFGVLSVA
jgi:hypothetical protein